MSSMKDCPCKEETPDPCPMCGATVSGNDPVNGVCQAGTIRGERDELLAALKVAAQWMPLPDQAYTPDARRDAEIVQRALRLTGG